MRAKGNGLPVLLALSLVLACAKARAPASTPATGKSAPEYSARAFFETISVSGGSFSHDESHLLVSMDETGIYNAYAVPLGGEKPTALTRSRDNAIFALSYFPHDDRFLYSSDQGGNELNHIHVREQSGESRDLTPGDKVKALFYGWSRDKQYFYIGTNERDAKVFDLYRYATKDYQRELVFQNPGELDVSGISLDGRWIALTRTLSNVDANLYLVDVLQKNAEPRLITEHQGHVEYDIQGFSPDSKTLYYTTNGHGEFRQVWAYDLGTGQHRADVVEGWDIMYVAFSENGKYKIVAVNEDARTVVRVIETASGKELALPSLPEGDIRGVVFSPSETKMMFYVSSDRTPLDLYVLDLATGQHRRLTSTLNPAIDPANLVDAEVVRYKSFDGRDIPALLYRPVRASAGARVPALVFVHGGPGGQSRRGYSPLLQFLANHGYAVLAVNNRGSSGYGKTFHHLDDRNHGEGDLKDCVFGRKYLESLDWVDGSRVGIMGGSYGGFMVLAALAFEPDAFNLGIDIFGVANWIRTLTSIPPWWTSFRDALYAELGNPEADKERLERISPLMHAGNIKKPLLVVQGANDPRVLKIESDEIVNAVKKNNVPVEYIVFPDEGHGFVKRENRITSAEAYLRFLEAHL